MLSCYFVILLSCYLDILLSPDNKENKVGGASFLSQLSLLFLKVTVELSLRADKELKEGDQIPIQFVVRFAGMSLFYLSL